MVGLAVPEKSKGQNMNGILIFDADNTIWDTDAVFRAAQIALLRRLLGGGLRDDPERQLQLLRDVDQRLISLHGQAEYDFKTLIAALAYHYSRHCSVSEAIDAVMATGISGMSDTLTSLIESAHQAFKLNLNHTPSLYPDAWPVLSKIRSSVLPSQRIILLLLSEGNKERIERILGAHAFRERDMFDEIILMEKNVEAMLLARTTGLHLLGLEPAQESAHLVPVVLVGDSMSRDIRPANKAKFVTIYKPSAFKGMESPQCADEEPNYYIHQLSEIPSILRQMGFYILP